MNYKKLVISLEKYGRDNNYAYVCDSYKPHLRKDKKYKQWKNVLDIARFKALTTKEKEIMQLMLGRRMAFSAWVRNLNIKFEK